MTRCTTCGTWPPHGDDLPGRVHVTAIRRSRPDDSQTIRSIERAAGERFRTVGLDAVADEEPLPVKALDAYAAAGHSWVVVEESDRPVAYALFEVVDGQPHLEQMSVHPDHQGRGLARALVDRITAWASATGWSTITLTTFAEVPWNRPLWEHLGFRVLAASGVGPELRAVRDAETARGLDPHARVCMRLDLDSGTSGCSGADPESAR